MDQWIRNSVWDGDSSKDQEVKKKSLTKQEATRSGMFFFFSSSSLTLPLCVCVSFGVFIYVVSGFGLTIGHWYVRGGYASKS